MVKWKNKRVDDKLFVPVPFTIFRLFGIGHGTTFFPNRTVVTGNSVFVDPIADADSQLLFEPTKFRSFGKIVSELVRLKNRSTNMNQFQGDLLPLIFGNNRKIGRENQRNGVEFREEQPLKLHLVGCTKRLCIGSTVGDTTVVTLVCRIAAPLDKSDFPLFRRVADLKELGQPFTEPLFIGCAHTTISVCGRDFSTGCPFPVLLPVAAPAGGSAVPAALGGASKRNHRLHHWYVGQDGSYR